MSSKRLSFWEGSRWLWKELLECGCLSKARVVLSRE